MFLRDLKNSLHRRTGPFPFPPFYLGGGGGGGTTYFARISYPCPKVEYVWPMHFCRTWEGGGGGCLEEEENTCCIGDHGVGGCGMWTGLFWISGYENPVFVVGCRV